MMVTPQQMVDTVGAAVVREVERLLEHLREEAVRDATNSMSLQSDDQSSSNSWDDDDLLAVFSTTEDEERKNKNRKDADEFFAEFGPQLI